MTTPPQGEVEGPLEPVPGGQPSTPPSPTVPAPGTYWSRNAGRRASLLQGMGQVVTRDLLRTSLQDADSEFQQALAAGRALVAESQGHADETRTLVGQAGTILDTVEGTGADVVAKHTEVLTLHGEAIGAASDAAEDAALAAAKALEASDHAGNALVAFEAQQAQVDSEQDARLELHEQLIDAVRQAQVGGLQPRQGRLIKGSANAKSDAYVSVDDGGTTQTVTALGSWTGTIYAEYGRQRGSNDSFALEKREWQVPTSTGGRTYTFPHFGYNLQSDFSYLDLNYSINPGTQQVRDQSTGSMPVPSDTWTTVPGQNWVVPAGASRVAIYFRAGWEGAQFTSAHGLRILVNGAPIDTWGPVVNIGPLLGTGYRVRDISIGNAPAATPGATVSFQVWSGSAADVSRQIRDTTTRISWVTGG